MSAKAFRYEFTMKELGSYLFSKKKCPKCGNKMRKTKVSELIDGSTISTMSTPLYIQGRKIKQHHYVFKCPKCNSKYKLKELI